jgi:hypothetical protein
MLLRTTAGAPVIFADDATGPEFFGARIGAGKMLRQKDSVKTPGVLFSPHDLCRMTGNRGRHRLLDKEPVMGVVAWIFLALFSS